MEYAIVLYFNKTAEDKINSLIYKIANETGNKYMVDNDIPPHITISLFKYDEEIDTIINIVENNISKLNKNKIGIASIGIFNPNVLFLSPMINDYLIELNKNISKIIKTNDNVLLDKNYIENQWIPHISLAVKLNKNELVNGIKTIIEYFEIFEIEANRIGLAECNPYKNIKYGEYNFNKLCKEGKPAHNRSVCASPLSRLGLRKNAVGLAPFVRFFSATFFVRWNCFAIPLSRTKTVAYSQNVICNFALN